MPRKRKQFVPQPAAPRLLRPDTAVRIIGPRFHKRDDRVTFLPEEPALAAMPHAQVIVHEPTAHVHDPDWCFGRPKSTSGFIRAIPPLPSGIVRYDPYSEPPQEDPVAELSWLEATQFEDEPTTLQMLRWHNMEGTLLSDSLAESISDEFAPDLEDRLAAPVIRRIDWEREQAETPRATKLYLVPGDSQNAFYVSHWSGKDASGRPNPPPYSPTEMQAIAERVGAYAAAHGITPESATNVRAEYAWRMAFYGRDWLFSLLKPLTLKTFFGTDEDDTAFWRTHMPDEDPYRLSFVEDDDDLHRPEPGYESDTIIAEIRAAQLDAELGHPDYSMGDDDRFGRWRLDQRYVDLLALRSASNDSFISLDVDSTLELRDNEKRIVADGDGRFHYSQWETRRVTDYRWRAADGSRRWIREGWLPIGRADNISWCSCRVCGRHLAKEAARAEFRAIADRWRARRAS